MQNVLKRKNMYLEGYQVILNLFPQNHYQVIFTPSPIQLLGVVCSLFGCTKNKNMYLEGFQVIQNLFQKIMFQTILNLLICISKNYQKVQIIFVGVRYLSYEERGSESYGHFCNYQCFFYAFPNLAPRGGVFFIWWCKEPSTQCRGELDQNNSSIWANLSPVNYGINARRKLLIQRRKKVK